MMRTKDINNEYLKFQKQWGFGPISTVSTGNATDVTL